jgi:hypothetical protein
MHENPRLTSQPRPALIKLNLQVFASWSVILHVLHALDVYTPYGVMSSDARRAGFHKECSSPSCEPCCMLSKSSGEVA